MRSIVRSRGGNRLTTQDRFKVGVMRTDGGIFIPDLQEDADGFIPLGWMNIGVFDPRGIKKAEYQFRNLVVNQGKQDILNVYFTNGTQTANTSWFMGLIIDTGFTGIVAGDTAASHGGWNEATGYTQSTRPQWGQGAPGTGVTTITNASPVTFDMNATANIRGGFIITNSTKGGTTGKLWAAATFSAQVPVNNGDQMKVTYNLSC